MNIRDIFHTVSNFLFSRANREFLIFLFFFAVAGIFWLMMTLNENYEKELVIPVYYTGMEKNVVLTSSETDHIRVVVSDKGYTIASYLYGDAVKPLPVNFADYARKGRGVVPAADLQKLVAARFNASTKIVSVKPEHLIFYYNKGEKKKVPVKWRGSVVPEELYYISNVQIEPDSVIIYASSSKLDSIASVSTESLSYADFHDTLIVDARLERISGVKMVPDVVKVSFFTDVLTEESIDGIPIIGVNMPPGKVLRTFPAKVRVKFVTGIKTYRTLSPSDFRVVADYREFGTSSSPKCTIRLVKVPDGISRVKLDTTSVDYLIEEQNQ